MRNAERSIIAGSDIRYIRVHRSETIDFKEINNAVEYEYMNICIRSYRSSGIPLLYRHMSPHQNYLNFMPDF